MKYREVSEKLRGMGCIEIPRRSGGSHRKWINPATTQGTVIPDWGSDDLKLGTIRTAVKRLGIEWEDFEKA